MSCSFDVKEPSLEKPDPEDGESDMVDLSDDMSKPSAAPNPSGVQLSLENMLPPAAPRRHRVLRGDPHYPAFAAKCFGLLGKTKSGRSKDISELTSLRELSLAASQGTQGPRPI